MWVELRLSQLKIGKLHNGYVMGYITKVVGVYKKETKHCLGGYSEGRMRIVIVVYGEINVMLI